MKTARNRTMNVLTLAVVAMGVVGLTVGTAYAAPVSIDFDHPVLSTQSGEPDNSLGLQLPGQVGPWNSLDYTADSGGTVSVTTTEGPTLTIFPATGVPAGTGSPKWSAQERVGTGALRIDEIRTHTLGNTIPWELTGLVPDGEYNLIVFGTGTSPAVAEIDGFGPGSTEPTEQDYDFEGVVADGTGMISGVFGPVIVTSGYNYWSGMQFELIPEPSIIPEPATLAALGLALTGLGGYVKRRRKLS